MLKKLTVTVLVVLGKQRRWEITVRAESPSPAAISSFRVNYKMERECAWYLEMATKLVEVILQHEK